MYHKFNVRERRLRIEGAPTSNLADSFELTHIIITDTHSAKEELVDDGMAWPRWS